MSASATSSGMSDVPRGAAAHRSVPSIPDAPKISARMPSSARRIAARSQRISWKVGPRRIESGVSPVLRRQDRVADGPGDTEGLVRPQYAVIVVRSVQLGAFVEDVGDGRECTEAVCKSGGNPNVAWSVAAQRRAHPLPEGRRTDTHVHGDVEDAAAHARNELALGTAQLVMETTEHALARARVVVLRKPGWNSFRREASEDIGVVRLIEEPAIIFEHPRFQDEHAGQLRTIHLHR